MKGSVTNSKASEFRQPRVTVVVGSGMSDIGKGWLASAIGGRAPAGVVAIKIDPMLNLGFPDNIGTPMETLCARNDCVRFRQARMGEHPSAPKFLTDDFVSYAAAGIPIYPECNIVFGDLLQRFLARPDGGKKRTFADVSAFLADEITSIARARSGQHIVIEVGGTVEDYESHAVAGAARLLGSSSQLGSAPDIVLLSYFEFSECSDPGRWRVKTHQVRRGIRGVLARYGGLRLQACFVRRRNVPESEVSDDRLRDELGRIAHEAQVPTDIMWLLPNVDSPTDAGYRDCVNAALSLERS